MPRSRPKRPARLLAAALLLAGCGGSDDPAVARRERAEAETGDILIGAAWPWAAQKSLLYEQGMQLAVDQLNAAGGVRGRRLRLLRADDQESVDRGRLVAQDLAKNPDVVAVIGHLQSYVTIPAAAVYDLSGLVLVSPAATSPELTRKGYRRVFRTTFSDVDVGRQMAEYALRKGYRRLLIYYSRDEYGRGLANAFEEGATGAGAQILERRSYDPSGVSITLSVSQTADAWANLGPDAVFVAGESKAAAQLARELRRRGVTAPLIGGDALATPTFLAVGGDAVEGTVIATAFSPEAPTPEVQRFTAAFRERYGVVPDVAAALGYDAVAVLARAMTQAGSAAPEKVAAALHGLRDWSSVTGNFQFSAAGDRSGFTIGKAVVRNGQFRYLDERAATQLATQAAARPESP